MQRIIFPNMVTCYKEKDKYDFLYSPLHVPDYNKRKPLYLLPKANGADCLKILSLQEAASILGCHPTTVLRYIQDGIYTNVFKNTYWPYNYFLIMDEVEEIRIYLKDHKRLYRDHYKKINKLGSGGEWHITNT